MEVKHPLLSVGDTVKALTYIRRADGFCHLEVGDTAKIRSVWQNSPTSPQIVDVTLPDGDVMIDIVLSGNKPIFEVVKGAES